MARHLPPDLVALYAGPDRRLAVLLRHTLVPLSEERPAWLAETAAAARLVAEALGVPSPALTVLQWRPPRDVLQVTGQWRRVWVGDPTRLRELVEVAGRRVEDDDFVAEGEVSASPAGWSGHGRVRAAEPSLGRLEASLANGWPGVAGWYRAMAPCWLAIEPRARRDLVLRTHEWTAEHVLGPAGGPSSVALDLYPVLLRCLPAEESGRWDRWIRLVTDDLERAVRVPPPRRDEAWARRLLLVPYSLPAPRAAGLWEEETVSRRFPW